MKNIKRMVFFLAACCGLAARASTPGGLDATLRTLVRSAGLTGDLTAGRTLPKPSDPLAQLGMRLFFSRALSGDKDTACASCHHPLLAGADGIALSIGVSAVVQDVIGPPRRHTTNRFFFSNGPTVGRNAPTTFNIAMWDAALLYDGRVESLGRTPRRNGDDGKGIRTPDTNNGVPDPSIVGGLVEAQARFPVVAVAEMLGKYGGADYYEFERLRTRLAARLGNYGASRGELGENGWLREFQQAFHSDAGPETLITYNNIALALAAYQRSQVFVKTPWNAYVKGNDAAIDATAKRGALIFYKSKAEGGAQCASCHRGDFFTDEDFHVLAVPQVGLGKGNGPTGDDDWGRYRTTTEPVDRYKYRTPTLLNVEVTAPYGHSGAYLTLEGIVRHHLDPEAAFAHYDETQLGPDVRRTHIRENTERALSKLAADRAAGTSRLENISLSDEQVADLVAFLKSLTDPCVKIPACLEPWIPSNSGDPDGLMLRAQFQVAAGPH